MPTNALASWTYIQSIIAKLSLVRDLLAATKVQIPGAISDAISRANQIASAFQGGLPPTSFENDVKDLAAILTAVEVQTGHSVADTHLTDIIAALNWTATGIADVLAGQFATVATSHVSAEGEQVPVALLACRMDKGAAAIAAGFQEAPLAQQTVAAGDYDALQAQLDTANAQNAALEKQIAELQAALEAKTQALDTCDANLSAAQAEIGKLSKQPEGSAPQPSGSEGAAGSAQ